MGAFTNFIKKVSPNFLSVATQQPQTRQVATQQPQTRQVATGPEPYPGYNKVLDQLHNSGGPVAKKLMQEMNMWKNIKPIMLEGHLAQFFMSLYGTHGEDNNVDNTAQVGHSPGLKSENPSLFNEIAKWFGEISKNMFDIITPQQGESLLPNWRANDNYYKANPRQWVNPKVVGEVIRPLLKFKGSDITKCKAILNVKER